MALNINDLADVMNAALAVLDKDGAPIATTDQMKTYAEAVITTLQTGIVSHITGTVNGVTAPGSPLVAGAALGGLVANLLPTTWASIVSGGNPLANPAMLVTDSTQSTAYLTSSCLVNFIAGTITGTCTNTPVSPGPLAAGAGTGGLILGLVGAAWAAAVMPPSGNPILTQNLYNAIAGYIMTNAEVEYASGGIIGTCPAGGGPLVAGTGVGGTIT